MKAELVVDCRNHHGEGIFWNPVDACVWWTDIEGCLIWSYEPTSGKSASIRLSERCCCFAPRADGGLIIAFADRISLYDPKTNEETLVAAFEPSNPETRLNDGRTDRYGRFVVGGMNEVSGSADSSVVIVDTDLTLRKLFGGVSCANSICFSPDGAKMYFADTPDREIVAYDYDTLTGTATNRRQHASFADEPGLPDGSCVDSEGGVWNAEWQGRRVVRIAPSGEIDRIIDVPVWKPTCCAFGGPNLDTLFITTSRMMTSEDVLEQEPESGGLFAVKPGFRGVPDTPFNG